MLGMTLLAGHIVPLASLNHHPIEVRTKGHDKLVDLSGMSGGNLGIAVDPKGNDPEVMQFSLG
ncbi:hypothetical protein DOTSEDRAFT_67899 [Dothistroma septosporum NZE10]|uniref:Uncharacterized protein n=1 Tax=Dothistroma septosporum (strain NZE10 / CBS 128990) TaxID=675120 RepID=N1Q164_DOTSN|nr:hypothetical protein DOTSEDRAFT_67899 [Dothistroma septosporum NZE10]